MPIAVVDRPNGPFRLAEAPAPAPREGEVVVQIHASGLNPLDAKIRAGAVPHARQPLPAVLGLDLAGGVVRVGFGVPEFKEGDEVYGMTGGVGGLQGSLAECAAVDAKLLAPKPRGFSMRKAIKRFGHVVSCLGWGAHSLAPLSMRGATYSGVFTLLPLLTGVGREHHGQILRQATALAERGDFRPIVDPRRFTLEMADAAHAVMTGSFIPFHKTQVERLAAGDGRRATFVGRKDC